MTSKICTPTPSGCACYLPRGYQCIYQDALETGLRIPPHKFIVALLNFFQLDLGQIVPNAWRLVVSFVVLALREGITPSVDLFNMFFRISAHPSRNSWYYFRGREGRSLLTDPDTSVKD